MPFASNISLHVANRSFCDERHSRARRRRLGFSIRDRHALAKTSKGDSHAYPVRPRDLSRRRIYRLVSRTNGRQNPFYRFPRSPRNDGQYRQSTAGALQRLQHHLLSACPNSRFSRSAKSRSKTFCVRSSSSSRFSATSVSRPLSLSSLRYCWLGDQQTTHSTWRRALVRRSSVVGRVITDVASEHKLLLSLRSQCVLAGSRLRNCDGNAEALFDCV